MNFFRKYILGKEKPEQVTQPIRSVPGHGQPGAENYNFSENIAVCMAATGNAGMYRPADGTAVLEVLSGNGVVLTMDTIKVSNKAPKGPYHAPDGTPATNVRPGAGKEYQVFQIPLTGDCPFDLPQSILDKQEIGGQILRAYWSCE